MLFHATGLVTLFDGNAFCYLVLWFRYLSSHAVLLNFNAKGLFSPMEFSVGGRVSLHIEYFLGVLLRNCEKVSLTVRVSYSPFHFVAFITEMYILGEFCWNRTPFS